MPYEAACLHIIFKEVAFTVLLCVGADLLLCHVTDTSLQSPPTTTRYAGFISRWLALSSSIFFPPPPLSSLLSATLQSTRRPLNRWDMCFWFEKPAIEKEENRGKYSSGTLTRARSAIIYEWYVLCGRRRVELWSRLWEGGCAGALRARRSLDWDLPTSAAELCV